MINIQRGIKIAVLIIAVVIIFTLLKYGHQKYQEKVEVKQLQDAYLKKMAQLHTDENYKKMEQLFTKVEKNLVEFTSYLDEEIFSKETMIEYCSKEDLYKQSLNNKYNTVLVCDGKILEGSEYSSPESIAELKKHPQIVDVIERIGKENIIQSFSLGFEEGEEDLHEIFFNIDVQYTPFITQNNGSLNSFIFSKRAPEKMSAYGYREIKKNWYSWITPPPE